MREFKKLEKLDSALEKLLKKVKSLDPEKVSVYHCSNRVLAEDVFAPIDVPPFDRAAMDGYALKAEDTFGASQENPIVLKIVGKVEVGEKPKIEIKKGEAVEISTGAAMPKGANAVVMLEYTRRF
ncbi:MAG: hypothetical protein NZ895_00155, partial [Archaeoglobaceae archaeon]|nr:hypothetical protein [Archaeoglobaceae archaeon]MCX8152349.1 hypothetical protein [Archaeoglobaceae archaeon]MDW8013623.1 hypothetical protein [Archaeoglobaceae archaeon]